MLSADIFCDASGKHWTAVVCRHPEDGGPGVEIFRKEGLRSQWAAETSMEAACRRALGGESHHD